MNLLLAIARHDYGRIANGDSYEYDAWFRPLQRSGHSVDVFDTFDPRWSHSPVSAGRALERHVAATRPDLVLMMLIERDVDLASIDRIRASGIEVANWFADDTWRYRAFSRHVAPHFSWVVTTCREAEVAYRSLPGVRAVFSPWGYDETLYHPVDVEPTIDVGFVGQRYGRRGDVIQSLIDDGIPVVARGSGWPAGRVESGELAATYAATRINLNFLESSAGPFQRSGIRVRGSWRADRWIVRHLPPPTQLKARPFEITACGAFLLTNTCPELPEFFGPHEISTFASERELAGRIRWYLDHPVEREAIAAAGRARSEAYAWPTVLDAVFRQVGVVAGVPS